MGKIEIDDPLKKTQDATSMRLWSFWDGPKPPYIDLCQETLLKYNPGATILSMDDFRDLQTEDRDVDLSHLLIANQSDWIRLYLLRFYGGLWLDADCIVLRPLDRFMDALRCCWSLSYREAGNHIGGGLLGAPPDSYHIREIYDNATSIVRSKKRIKWSEILGRNVDAVLQRHRGNGFFCCDCNQFLPVPFHRKWGKFFARGSDEEHAAKFSEFAYTYMLSNNSFPTTLRNMSREEILTSDYFISYIFRKALT